MRSQIKKPVRNRVTKADLDAQIVADGRQLDALRGSLVSSQQALARTLDENLRLKHETHDLRVCNIVLRRRLDSVGHAAIDLLVSMPALTDEQRAHWPSMARVDEARPMGAAPQAATTSK